jgi:HlyD family secretion protein
MLYTILLKTKKWFYKNKVLGFLILIFFLIGTSALSAFLFKSSKPKEYILDVAKKGELVSSVTGTGQIHPRYQSDIRPKVDGIVTHIFVSNGEEVQSGDVIAELDKKNIQEVIRDATLEYEGSLSQAKNAKNKSYQDYKAALENGFGMVSTILADIPKIIAELDRINKNTLDSTAQRLSLNPKVKNSTTEEFLKKQSRQDIEFARNLYNITLSDYVTSTRLQNDAATEKLIIETGDTVKVLADAIKSNDALLNALTHTIENKESTSTQISNLQSLRESMKNTLNLSDFFKSVLNSGNGLGQSLTSTYETNLRSLAVKTNTYLDNLSSLENIFDNYHNIKGSNGYTSLPQDITLKQKQNILKNAKEKLPEYSIRAPFNGLISGLDMSEGDLISASKPIATLISKENIAEIPFNEIDVVKIKPSERVTLTFDAIPDLTITGEVSEIDPIGSAIQGVTMFNTKIIFDTQDERLKPGMSVNAEIIINSDTDSVLIPSSAIKSRDGSQFVEIITPSVNAEDIFQNTLPSSALVVERAIKTGLSNNVFTQVTSGLKEGDFFVLKTTENKVSNQERIKLIKKILNQKTN